MKKLLLAASLLSIFLVGFISLSAPAKANHAGCGSQAIVAIMPGSLSSSDCRSHNMGSSYYADYYSFGALAGDKVTIDMMAGFDTYLYLMDANSNLLISDDDSGEGYNSRIFEYQIPSTGSYVIEATSYGSGVTGDYTVSISGNSIPGGTGIPALLNGLKGTYIDGAGNIVGNQVDPDINFCSGSGCPSARAWPFGFSGDTDDFTVHWTGFVIPKYTENYTFYTNRDDDTTVAIGGVPIIVPGCGSGCAETRNVGSVAIPLTAGVPYSIDIVYQQTACCVARAILLWSSPSQPKSVIGSDSLITVLPPTDSVPSISSFYLTAGSNPVLPSVSGGSSDPYSGSTPPGTTKTQTVWANYVGTAPTPPIRFSAVSVPAGVNVTFSPDNCTPGILWSPENPLSTPDNTCSVQMNMAVPANALIDDKYTITVTAQRGTVPEATMVYVLEVAPTFVSCGQSLCAKFINQEVPTSMVPGSTNEVKIIMQNTGTAIWTRGGVGVAGIGVGLFRLGSQNPQDNQTWGTHRAEMPLPAILPGETATFKFNVTAPSTPGTYNFQWRMVLEGGSWFGDYTPNLAINVAGTSAIPFSYQLTTTVSGNEDHTLDPGKSFSEAVKVAILSGAPNLINLTYTVATTNLGGVAPAGVSVSLNPTSCNVASGTGTIRDCSNITVQTSASTQPGSYVVNVKGQSQNVEGVSVLPFYFTVSSPTLIQQINDAINLINNQINAIIGGTSFNDLPATIYLYDYDSAYSINGTGNVSKKIVVDPTFVFGSNWSPKVALSSGGTTPSSGITASFSYPDNIPSPDADTSCDDYSKQSPLTSAINWVCLSEAVVNIPSNTPQGQYTLRINSTLTNPTTTLTVAGTPVTDPSTYSMFYVINVGSNPCPPNTTGPGVPNCTPDECPPGTVGSAGACIVPPSVFTHVLTDPNNTYAVNMASATTNTSGKIRVTAAANTIPAEGKTVSFTPTVTKVGALNTTGFTASASSCVVTASTPNCTSTITITASSVAAGQYIVSFASSANDGSAPGTISYTVTVTAPSGYSVTPTQTSFDFTYGSPDVRTTGFAVAGNPGAVTFLQPLITDENGSIVTPATSGINATVSPNVCAPTLTCPSLLVVSYTPVSPTLAPPSNKTFYIWGDTHAVNTPAAQKWTERVRVTITVR